MQPNKLHIVAFDIPDPPDYGGAIDVFYKIKALADAGVEIYLHCFQYGRHHSNELESICKKIWYYPRISGIRSISLSLPYIVNSRRNKDLLKHLTEIDAPILYEGLHTTYYHAQPALTKRNLAVRNHNIEHEYYRQLFLKENNIIKKLFFFAESILLKRYESRLQNIKSFFCLSIADTEYFKKLYPNHLNEFIAPFHPFDNIISTPGVGKYCLYHGNLSHPENKEAALYLLKNVFPFSSMPSVIAGTNPCNEIIKECKQVSNCTLIINPGKKEMETLIKEAHIHVLPTFQPTGMKLKLLYALYSGRHVLVNPAMLHGTTLASSCHIADSNEAFINKVNELKNKPFSTDDIQTRTIALNETYNNKLNAEKIIKHLLH